jgi:hypothetical protein
MVHEVVALDTGQGNGRMRVGEMLHHTGIRVQGGTAPLPH